MQFIPQTYPQFIEGLELESIRFAIRHKLKHIPVTPFGRIILECVITHDYTKIKLTYKKIASIVKCSERTVINCMKRFRELGVITTVRLIGSKGYDYIHLPNMNMIKKIFDTLPHKVKSLFNKAKETIKDLFASEKEAKAPEVKELAPEPVEQTDKVEKPIDNQRVNDIRTLWFKSGLGYKFKKVNNTHIHKFIEIIDTKFNGNLDDFMRFMAYVSLQSPFKFRAVRVQACYDNPETLKGYIASFKDAESRKTKQTQQSAYSIETDGYKQGVQAQIRFKEAQKNAVPMPDNCKNLSSHQKRTELLKETPSLNAENKEYTLEELSEMGKPMNHNAERVAKFLKLRKLPNGNYGKY